MYSKDDGYIYFTDIDEAKALYRIEDVNLWETTKTAYGVVEWVKPDNCPPLFSLSCANYRRQLTPDFRIRKEFHYGDSVSAYGVNGVVDNTIGEAYPIHVAFGVTSSSFTKDGRGYTWHKTPSLSHGHDSTVDAQKYPVERVPEYKSVAVLLNSEKKQSLADEVAECIINLADRLRKEGK